MDQEFSLSYEQLTNFAEAHIRKCKLDSHGMVYICESAKASAILSLWYELAINGYTSQDAFIEADYQRLKNLIMSDKQ
ncbi:hypothetical protein HLX14_004066 [Escherichia coli]|uniref:Phage protein n=1 Tax=Edwardsiella anguillarum ET080813 TaxID=667120 RepID=A0A076LRN0_9GAMM|nr:MULTISPECIES: hypothetical protein [Edwardsiella]EFP0183599.1 hypothetical protein [Escherichia coli]EGA8339538.1 hypothetical protein [Salmonella enterica subsp. enterica serovar Saintpaul]EKG9744505.1 hypothetical protein [Salmonella enterica]AIJ10621.1 Hypothetical protein ETEE_p1030 [Edwardsiella anguillarum ET080813]EKS7763288.1 hypothetical protein [Edwardsiella ictaluri]